MDPQAIGTIITTIVIGVLAYFSRLGHEEQKRATETVEKTNEVVSNDLLHSVERIEEQLGHVSTRIDDHIAAHKEWAVEREDT